MAKSTEPNQLDLISFNLAFKTDWKLIFELILIAHETMVGYNATGTVLLTKGIGAEPNPLEINLLEAHIRQKQSKSQSACEERDALDCHLALRQWRVKKLFLKIL